jgi:uncharacterized secreted protein with C-terminal beta-propeller domain
MIKQKNLIKIFVSSLIFAITLSGCALFPQKTTSKPKPTTEKKQEVKISEKEKLADQKNIKKFANYDELAKFIEENNNSGIRNYGGFGGGMEMNTLSSASPVRMMKSTDSSALGVGAGESQAIDSPASPTSDYSTTNIQVKGVDEADIIKTDGKYIYAVSNNDVFIVEAVPAEQAIILSKISFESRPQDIYINGNNLVVFGYNDQIYTEKYSSILPPQRRSSYMFFKTFDLTDKTDPKQIRDLDFEGNFVNSRMIGDYVYFVTTKYSYDTDEIPVPIIMENGQMISTDKAIARCNCPDIYYFSMPYQNFNMTSIHAINVSDNTQAINTQAYLLTDNQNMYVSQNNIYITYTKYLDEQELSMKALMKIALPLLDQKDRDKIAKIQATENFILSPAEKIQKYTLIFSKLRQKLSIEENNKLENDLIKEIKQQYEDISKELEKTVVHKIAINKGEIKYQTVGEVTGQVLNQFSMDENNDYFRIATTKNRSWSQLANLDCEINLEIPADFKDCENNNKSYSNLYVLDKDLKQVGQIENMATGERIYSVRFMQDRAYMVTFKQTDPLFVIDLKDPANPAVLGELKIPGYSNYLHPYDNDTLIGLGQDTKENEWGGVNNQGIKLSLFDVSNVAEPKEIGTYQVEDPSSSSTAQYDHKAFLFSKEKNLLVIPLTKEKITEAKIETPKCAPNTKCAMPMIYPVFQQFQGALVLNVDKTGFKLKGEIEHSDLTQKKPDEYNYDTYNTAIQRSLYINDILYTFSNRYLKMNNLADLKEVKNLKLKTGDQNEDFEVIKN